MKKEFLIPEVETFRFVTSEAVATSNPLTGGTNTNDDTALFNLSDTVVDGTIEGGEGNLN